MGYVMYLRFQLEDVSVFSSKHVSCICFTIHRLCVTVSEDMYLHKLSFEQLRCSCSSKFILDVE